MPDDGYHNHEKGMTHPTGEEVASLRELCGHKMERQRRNGRPISQVVCLLAYVI